MLRNFFSRPSKLAKLGYWLLVALLGYSAGWAFPPSAYSAVIFLTLIVFIALLNLTTKNPGFLAGYVFYLGASWAFIAHWFSYYFWLNVHCSYFIAYLLSFAVCLYVSLYIGAISWLYQRLRSPSVSFNLLLLFPALWVLAELIRGEFFPRSWYVLAYTQVENILFRGYFALFGMYFVSWLMVALCGLVIYAYISKRYYLTLAILSVFGGASYFIAQIEYTHSSGSPLKFALIQPNVMSTLDYDAIQVAELENISRRQIEANPADVYVLPETVFGTRMENLSSGYLSALKELLAQRDAVLFFGSPFLSANGEAQAGTIQLDGDSLGYVYIKENLVPWGEHDPLVGTFLEPLSRQIAGRSIAMVPGANNQQPAAVKQQLIAFNICYENAINDFVAASARNASIILNQSDLSWYGDTEMLAASLQFSQARALENQRYFLEDADSGITAVINRQGQIVSRLPTATQGTLVASVQGYSGQTPFQYWGNYPIWVLSLVIIFIAAVCRLIAQAQAWFKRSR